MKYSSLLLLSLGLASAGAFAGNTSAGVGGALGGALLESRVRLSPAPAAHRCCRPVTI